MLAFYAELGRGGRVRAARAPVRGFVSSIGARRTNHQPNLRDAGEENFGRLRESFPLMDAAKGTVALNALGFNESIDLLDRSSRPATCRASSTGHR